MSNSFEICPTLFSRGVGIFLGRGSLFTGLPKLEVVLQIIGICRANSIILH